MEITGDVGPGLRRDVKEAIGRGLVKSGDLDGAIVLVESEDEAKEAFVRYRPRLRDTGYLWMITRKRGHDRYLNQMALVPFAKRLGLIDNKTCSIDDERSGIRFVIPRALRGNGSQSAAYPKSAGVSTDAHTPVPLRPSADERERVVRLLRDRSVEGRLSTDTFAERVGLAYPAKSQRRAGRAHLGRPPRPPARGALLIAAVEWLSRPPGRPGGGVERARACRASPCRARSGRG